MKKNLSKIIMGSLMAGALTFLPISGGVKSANAGEEIRNNRFYDEVKKEGMSKYGEYLENIIIEKEKQFLVVERHLLKKGKNPKAYFEKARARGEWISSVIFKGNEVRLISTYTQGKGFAKPRELSEQEKNIIMEEFVGYLIESKQEGYKVLIMHDSNLQNIKEARQIEIDEYVGMIRKALK